MEINIFKHNNYDYFAIKNKKNLEITFCALGASIYSIKYKNDYITYHPENLDEFETSTKYYGKTLGRVAGRIKGAKINIDGVDYKLDANEKGNTLHGGFKNIAFQVFDYEISEDSQSINIVFKYTSEHLECGFPATLRIVVVYSINKNGDSFNIHYLAIPDRKTVINMSSHIYWRLTGEDILDHELYIKANQNTVVDPINLVPIDSKPVDELFNFDESKKIGKDIFLVAKKEKLANGYDHGFIFYDNFGDEVITLKNNHIQLSVKTNMEMAQIYCNCYPVGGPIKQYGNDKLYGGIAIEPQMFFTNFNDIICDKNHPFNRYFGFEIKEC